MTVIAIRENDLFRCGLVEVSLELSRVIVAEAKKRLGKRWLHSITEPLLQSIADSFYAENAKNRLVLVKRHAVRLPIFIMDIRPDDLSGATVTLRLSLPLIGETRECSYVWLQLLEKIGTPSGATVKDGELDFNVVLGNEFCPVEIPNHNGCNGNGQKFFTIRKTTS